MPIRKAVWGSNRGAEKVTPVIPIQESDIPAAIRLCVLAKQAADAAAGHLVLLGGTS